MCVLVTSCQKRARPVAKKPVIYLYPETRQEVTVKLNFNGKLRATYPQYKNAWNVVADPQGNLTDVTSGHSYQYLFYDGLADVNNDPFTQGFTVNNDSLIPFLQHSLAYVGLNQKEYNDMISFWIPEMNEKKFCLVRFRVGNDCNEISSLAISPQPKTEIRVMIEFITTDEFIPLKKQVLPHYERKGFTVVEWGGLNLSVENSVLPQ